MSDKLNQSLDEIVSTRRKGARNTRPRRVVGRGAKPAAPIGGVKKTTKQPKSNDKITKGAAPIAPKSGESKILVSNLPHDVTETQIKAYFGDTVGSVKRVLLSYGPNGQSRGVATVIFNNPVSAAKAAKDLDKIHVDGRPMKIEVLVTAKDAPEVPAAKKLADRVSQPKNAAKATPKPATGTKDNKAGGKKAANAERRNSTRRGRNAGRPKAKTAEELDQEMADYWEAPKNGDTAMSGGAVQPTNVNADAMADETL